MFWTRTSAPPSGLLQSTPPTAEEHRSASESIAELLTLYAKFAFDTEHASARETRQSCSDWSARALGAAPGRRAKLQDGSEPLRVDWSGLLSFFREHRQGEYTSVSSAREDLGETVRAFSRVFHEMLQADNR
ncbi:MAG: hypothetical protein RJA70_4140, partial [Pseudomonadota bacterium]